MHRDNPRSQGWGSWIARKARTGAGRVPLSLPPISLITFQVVGSTAKAASGALASVARRMYETMTGDRIEEVITGILERLVDVKIEISNSGPSECIEPAHE